MTTTLMFALDLVAIAILVLLLYFPRHHRKDMVVALVGINVGLLAVTAALQTIDLSVGVGFGLFAVLSIIRLRSSELDQQEVAYYFAALALGLLGGVILTPDWLGPMLMVAVVASLAIVDHPRLFARFRVQAMTLERPWTDEAALVAYLEELLGARVHHLRIRRVDMVEATTNVEVRYELRDVARGSTRALPGSVDAGAA